MKRLILCAILGAAACGPAPDMPPVDSTVRGGSATSGRFKVERVGVFEDGLAYGDKRGVYLITDTKTGAEYVGISGVGISSTAAHWVGVAGKGGHNVEDER